MAAATEATLLYTRSPGYRRHVALDMSPPMTNSIHAKRKSSAAGRKPGSSPLRVDTRPKPLLVDGISSEITEPNPEVPQAEGYAKISLNSENRNLVIKTFAAKERLFKPSPAPPPTPSAIHCGGTPGTASSVPPHLRSAPIRRLRHPLEESPLWGAAGGALSGALSLAVALPTLLLLFLFLPVCLLARSMAFLAAVWGRRAAAAGGNQGGGSGSSESGSGGSRAWAGDRPEPVRGNDARWLGPTWHRSVLHAVLVFDSGLEVGALRQLVATRVLPRHPRLTSRLIRLPPPAPPCWLPDPRFQIERHVFPAALRPSKRKRRRPRAPGETERVTERQLQRYVARLLAVGLPASKPPWELRVVRGYGKHLDTVAVVRVHQSLADGMSLVRLLCHALADSRVLHVPQQPHFGGQSFSLNAVRACLAGPLTLILWLLLLVAGGVKGGGGGWWSDCNPLTHRASWTGRITLSWSATIALPKITRVKHVTRSTVNDVLMAALAGAVRGLLQGCGIRQPPNLRVVLPVDLRSDISSPKPTSRMGCKVAPVVVALPVSIEGAVPRLWAMRKSLESLKSSPEPVVVYGATAALMALLPQRWACKVISTPSATASLQFSALPGPPSTLLVGGYPLKGVFPILPAPEGLGLSVSAFTYADQVYVTVAADSGLASAAKALLTHLQAQIELLWQLLLHRRLPGELRPPVIMRHSDLTRPSVQEIQTRLYHVQMELQKLSLQVVASSYHSSTKDLANSNFSPNGRGIRERPREKFAQGEDFLKGGELVEKSQTDMENLKDSVIVQVESEEVIQVEEHGAHSATQEDSLTMARLRLLKAEFVELLTELRKRRSLIEGSDSLIFEDEELVGELWRPRASSASRRSLSLAGLISAATGRPTPSTSACASPTSPTSHWDWEAVPQEDAPLDKSITQESAIGSAPAGTLEELPPSRSGARSQPDYAGSSEALVITVASRDNGSPNVNIEVQDMRLEEFRRICPTEKEI
ncbi:uncharacterized protein [Hetaerina americana]|uniref:uncharacterized protein n=1 Tax=Hetaerina americana TaxID=62018 RepID=UPI003A7F20F6